MMSMTRSLDLGCGRQPRNPFSASEIFGIDIAGESTDRIKIADLAIEPIPFPGGYFDFVTAFDFLEHVPRILYAPHRRTPFVNLMNEIHRVMVAGGKFFSHTPAYPHAAAFSDPTHVNIITEDTFRYYFDDTNRWAAVYGFTGAFRLLEQAWRGPHLLSVLEKVQL